MGIIGACLESNDTCQQVAVIGQDASWNTLGHVGIALYDNGFTCLITSSF
jgi:hypothetical protein